jgi:regulator of cell morphogenesis and NO signaling
MDFCCKGKQKLGDVLAGDAHKLSQVSVELENIFNKQSDGKTDYNSWSLSKLVDHIVTNHHEYVRQAAPAIAQHLTKVSQKHGDRFPYMKKVKTIFDEIKRDFDQHMMKEEIILFPRIKILEAANEGNKESEFLSIQAPIDVMEYEHENAGRNMHEFRKLTDNYSVPDGACMTFRISLEELKMFEEDLHQHVHLENNILFPKAMIMQRKKPSAEPGASCSL